MPCVNFLQSFSHFHAFCTCLAACRQVGKKKKSYANFVSLNRPKFIPKRFPMVHLFSLSPMVVVNIVWQLIIHKIKYYDVLVIGTSSISWAIFIRAVLWSGLPRMMLTMFAAMSAAAKCQLRLSKRQVIWKTNITRLFSFLKTDLIFWKTIIEFYISSAYQ